MKAIRILTLITALFFGGPAFAADSAQATSPVSLTGEKAVAQLKESGQYDSLAAAYEAARHAVRADEAEPDGVLHAQNPGHGLSASFDRHGLQLSVQRHGSEGERLTSRWRLDSVGRDGAVEKVPAGDALRRDGQRAEIVRDGQGLTEWFVNRPSGLEHGFTLDRRPAGEGALRLDIAIEGDLSPVPVADGQRIELHDAAGAKVLDYDKLRVWDAAGQELPARMEQSAAGGLRFLVEDAGARYPLTVDPTFTQQAYLKASNTGAGDQFGQSVAVSGDTVVVGANGEDSSTTDINSTPNESAASAGAAYVFLRSGSTWTEQAYLKAANAGAGDSFGQSVAVSGDTVVVGASAEDSSTTGINTTPNESALNAGAAYVFVRSGSTWSQQAYLKAAQVTAGDNLGFSVALSGDTVVVGANAEDSSTTGINTTPNESALNAGAAYVFVRSVSTWTQQAYLKAANAGAGDNFGASVAVSGDTVVVGANLEDSGTTGIDSSPDESAASAGAAYVFVRGSGIWTQQAYLKPAAVGTTQVGDNFGGSVAVSGDTVAVGAPLEDSANESVRDTGTTYVFVRSVSTWTQQASIKSVSQVQDEQSGWSVAVDGNTVVVGVFGKDFGADFNAGAVYVFVRSVSTWTERTPFLRASNFDQDDQFGGSVAVSGDTVVFGAKLEDSSTTGINSAPDESASGAGAAYVFTLIPDPTLTSVAPNTGSTAGGTAVTLTGTNFTGATNVTFGGTAATNRVVVNPTTITCTTPARAVGTASVVVTTPGGTNAANTLFTYAVPPSPPTLTSLNPNTGSTAGGTAVTLTGTNFTGATNVTFGGTAATNLMFVNATTLTCTTPARAAGTASVLVTTPGGTNAANTLFTYVAPSSPSTLSYSMSGRVGTNPAATANISGTAFGNNGWRLNGTALASDTLITFNFTIADTAVDTDGSANTGRFTGGTLTVSIPSMGVNSATIPAYHLMFINGAGDDEIVFQPATNSGFGVVAAWQASANPWPNQNVLSTVANPNASDIFGTSPNSIFSLQLQSGQTLTTSNTELLANPVFSSSVVPTLTSAPPSNLVFNFVESGGTVTMTYSGTLDTKGMTPLPGPPHQHNGTFLFDIPGRDAIGIAGTNSNTNSYLWTTNPLNFIARGAGQEAVFFTPNPGSTPFLNAASSNAPGVSLRSADINANGIWSGSGGATLSGPDFATLGLVPGRHFFTDAVSGQSVIFYIGDVAPPTLDAAATAAGLTGPNAGPLATPFGDGVPNLLKYAFNMDLSKADTRDMGAGGTSGLPRTQLQVIDGQTYLQVQFLRRVGSNLTYTPVKTSTLAAGSEEPLTGTPQVENLGGGIERVTINEPCQPGTIPKCFSRVRVTQ